MKKLKKICSRKNDILTDELMGNIIGRYDLPEEWFMVQLHIIIQETRQPVTNVAGNYLE
ncbi:MAG: hypothetical protein GX416_04565 [Bacteroidales bacterium]|nr:hypothetical protein [Bacteroidales bacterium]